MQLQVVLKNSARWFVRMLFVLLLVEMTDDYGFTADDKGATLRIGGTGSAIGTMKALTGAFEKKHPGVSVTIIPHLGTRGGINAVLKGAIDIGLAGRSLTPQESGLGLKGEEYARSPFVFVSGSRGAWLDLSPDLLARIYRGDVQRWSDGTQIRPVIRPEGDVDTHLLKAISPAVSDAVSRAASRAGMTVAADDQENCDLLEKIPGSFGSATLTQIVSEKRSLVVLPFGGVKPAVKSMVAGRYPYYKTFTLVTGPKSSPLSRRFVDFVNSPEGEKIIVRTGNQPLRSRR